MTEQDRKLGNRWFKEVWQEKRRESIEELMAPEAVLHDGGQDSEGPEGFYPFFDRIHACFTEIRTEVHDSIAEGDKLCFRWSFRAKHTGEGLGVPPTGAHVHVTGMAIIRVQNGKMVEGWQNWDMMGLMQQIQGQPRAVTYVS
jgi:steroid delta-isomerase-like uncharacterized protein